MAALVLEILLLVESFSLPQPCRFAIHLFSDNEGLVKQIVKMTLNIHHAAPRAAILLKRTNIS
jgi:hypothetical protein